MSLKAIRPTYKVEFNKFEGSIDEVTGKKLTSDVTTIGVYKRYEKSFLWRRWYDWGSIAYYSFPSILEYETVFFDTIDEVRDLLYKQIGVAENHRLD